MVVLDDLLCLLDNTLRLPECHRDYRQELSSNSHSRAFDRLIKSTHGVYEVCANLSLDRGDRDPKLIRLCDISPQDLEGKTVYKAVGCSACSNTGYHGRRGIYELLPMTSELRDLAFKRAPLGQLRAAAAASGMRNLLGDGKLKILDGGTTMEEVSRIAQVEGMVDIAEDSEVT